MKHLVVLFIFVLAFGLTAGCQTNDTSTTKANAVTPTEKVEGFWSVMGYLGGKLTNELGERLNLTKSDDKDKGVPTEVQLKIGQFEFTRTDLRKRE